MNPPRARRGSRVARTVGIACALWSAVSRSSSASTASPRAARNRPTCNGPRTATSPGGKTSATWASSVSTTRTSRRRLAKSRHAAAHGSGLRRAYLTIGSSRRAGIEPHQPRRDLAAEAERRHCILGGVQAHSSPPAHRDGLGKMGGCHAARRDPAVDPLAPYSCTTVNSCRA